MTCTRFLVNTKEFQKNTKENIPVTAFCSHSSQEGPINSISSPDCCICNTLSRDTHIACHKSHIAIWPYGHIAKIWPYGLMAIFKYGHQGSLYGCLWKKQYKCSNLVKKLNWLDLPVRNESKRQSREYFPLYFSEIPLYLLKSAYRSQIWVYIPNSFFIGFV